jgi:hypothetical protein
MRTSAPITPPMIATVCLVVVELGEELELDELPDGTLVEVGMPLGDDTFSSTKLRLRSTRGTVLVLPEYVTTSLCCPGDNSPIWNNV